MAYPENCFTGLIGIHGVCEERTAQYFLDDIPGIELDKLANVAETDTGSGEKLGNKLIDSASRMMAADVEAIYDGQYKVQSSLVTGCSNCSFTGNYISGANNGITIKNNTLSSFSSLLLDKLTVRFQTTGTWTVRIDDGAGNTKDIELEFEGGVDYELTNLNYVTRRKSIKVFALEAGAALAQLSCPRGSTGCGCSGKGSAPVSDLQYTGLTAGVETQQAYGFQPCAAILCDAADLLCFVAHSAPRMIGMALLYKTAELYFTRKLQSDRNNKTVGTNVDATKEDVKKYEKLYKDKLNGVGTRGVKDVVFTSLQQTTGDSCVVCNALNSTAWATG